MRAIKNVVIIGLGALGCAYATKLYALNPAGLTVIAGGDRAKRYQNEGFVINGQKYEFTYASPAAKHQPADLIIIAVKTHQLAQAVQEIKNFVGENTIIISLLNGITSEEIIGKEYGAEKVLYAVSFGLTANREGNNINFTSYGNISFGEAVNLQYSEKVLAVQEFFERAGIPYTIPENMLHTLWWKFMVNVGINQCSAVTRGRYGVFQTVAEAKSLMEAAMREVICLSERAGIHLTETDIGRWYEVLNSLHPDSRTSMLEDIECGRKTEVEAFAGTVCALGEKYGINTPVNRTLLHIIKVIEGC